MRQLLIDYAAGREYDLGKLVKENKFVNIGRKKEGNNIVLGTKSNDERVEDPDAQRKLSTVSQYHAKIYKGGENGEGLMLTELSAPGHLTQGTTISRRDVAVPIRVTSEEDVELYDGDKIFFARYGPVIYEETK